MKKDSRSSRLFPALLAMLLAVPAGIKAQVSLATVVDLAQRNSDPVRLAEANVHKAQAALAETKDPLLPSLVAASGLPAFPSVGFTGGVPSIITANLQSVVYSAPQQQYMGAARSGLRSANLSLKDAREQSALDASTTYLELDTATRELEVLHEQEAAAGKLVEITQQRAEAGVDPLMDLLQAKLTAAEIRLKRQHVEARCATLSKQIALLTGLPDGSIQTDHGSIPEIPQVHGTTPARSLPGLEAAKQLAISRQKTARGDSLNVLIPELAFNLQYVRSTTLLNEANSYFARPLPINNIVSGFAIQIPFFDWGHRDKARESAADALRARVEAEQAQHQNDLQIAVLTGTLQELDTQAEIASLKQQIATQQLEVVSAQLETGNGSTGNNGPAQLSPKAEQQARIDERQKFTEAMDASLDLNKTRLTLLRALGHMEDWLHEIHASTK